MSTQHHRLVRYSDEHPAKAELRCLLRRVADLFGLTVQTMDVLARNARIVSWTEGQALSLSGDTDGFVNFLMTGVVRIELVRHGATADKESGILKFVSPGEIFYLSPSPRHKRYHLRAVTHRMSEGQDRTMVALWGRATISSLFASLPAQGLTKLLETTWLDLSRLAEDRQMMMSLLLQERIVYILGRLAPRFGTKCQDGILIDLFLPDGVIGRLVNATRSRVNCAMRAAQRAGVLRREGRRVVLLAGS